MLSSSPTDGRVAPTFLPARPATMPRLTFLGTGNAFSSGGRGNQSLLLATDAAVNWLIDVGPTTILQAHRFGVDLATIRGLCLTHLHADHALGAPMLFLGLNFLFPPDRPFPVVGPPGTAAYLKRLWRLAYPDVARKTRFALAVVELDGTKRESTSVDGLHITAIAMHHSVPVNGYRIVVDGRLLAVSGDASPVSDLESLGADADLLVVECNTATPLRRVAHMSAQDHRGRSPYGAKRVAWVHVGPDVQAAKTDLEAELAVRIPDDGETWDI
jgi:ribonuclease BN (tRNA processing enzyme)